ncbi:type II toxin-antitoxin system Phd/YefM family antitoxin [Rhodopila globiformis]|uniref:Prevent-host-death protein n=1 Tax=Rhodopila globiformis TaxID=1071 RepID=A0A2S6NM35_RHOGL|nr:type II toxin-antitoxin system Phd/YefM family antitoxin [Rhodopila globiformis]PPQ36761.1 prevent-host-death protein [Rhodopila globiformis]
MAASETIGISAFKARCAVIFDRLARRELEQVIITRRGRPVAVLTPPKPAAEAVRDIYGFMRGSVTIPEGFDLTEPVLDEPLDAAEGILHR